ncbi:acyltransferase family protein [Terrimonas alba]|uniref:acyltransferase family protein n=1 Tax=Terrimonas alba TaxID=3349636 RepID=UPI0035F3772B
MIPVNKERKFFNSLQIFRGFAALMVVFHHEWIAFSHFHGADSPILGFLGSLGKYGVDFFFVLSGFIITYSNYEKAGIIRERKPYLINRVLRIYLPYLPVSILMLILYYFFPSASEGKERDISLLTSLTLVPAGKPALSVAWTLVHEMMFYLLFLSWFFSKKAWYWLVMIWAMVIIALNFFSTGWVWRDHAFFSYLFSFYNLEFILGFLAATALRKMKGRSKALFLILGLITVVMVGSIKWLHKEEATINAGINLLLAAGFAIIILGSIGSRLDQLNSPNLLMILGNASYSIYLVHNLCISIFIRFFMRFQGEVPKFVIFLSVFLICCIAGVLYSKLFEEYLLNKFKRKLIPAKVKPTPQLAQTAE